MLIFFKCGCLVYFVVVFRFVNLGGVVFMCEVRDLMFFSKILFFLLVMRGGELWRMLI